MKSSFRRCASSPALLPINVINRVPLMLWLVLCLVMSKHNLLSATVDKENDTASSSWSTADTLVLIYGNNSVGQFSLIEDTFWEYVLVVGAVPDRDRVTFTVTDSLHTLWQHLNDPTFTTIIYAMDDQVQRDVFCELSLELSTSYKKNVLFWPCPNRMLDEHKGRIAPATYESISVAVGEVLQAFNVTHATILATGDEVILPLTVATHLQSLRFGVDFNSKYYRNVDDAPGTAIVICGGSVGSPAMKSIVQQFTDLHRNHTKILVVDAGNEVFHNTNICTRAWQSTSSSSSMEPAFSEENENSSSNQMPDANNYNNSNYHSTTGRSSIQHSTFGLHVLTLLSRNFGKYLKLLINQEPIVQPANPSVTEQRQRRRRRNERSAAATAAASRIMENQIKSSVVATTTNDAVDESGIELMPEILSKIKHFYSTSSAKNASNSNMDNVFEYCQEFLANNFQFDGNTTLYVCENLLREDDIVDNAANKDDEEETQQQQLEATANDGVTQDTDVVDEPATATLHSRCPLVVEWFALFDFIISTADINSSGMTNRDQVTVPNADDDNHDVDDDTRRSIADDDYEDDGLFEYNVMEYDAELEGFAWPPVLRLKLFQLTTAGEAEILSRGTSSSSSSTPSFGSVYADWVAGGLNMFWKCGLHCWAVTLLIVLMFLMSMFGSVAAGIAIRNCLLKRRLSKGPNKIVLSATDFVFPEEGGRLSTRHAEKVEEGIEVMLCCWLQSMHEFGGPEIEKPDLLKGSIGSLKNLGVSNTINTSTTMPGSGSTSLSKHRHHLFNRARYNTRFNGNNIDGLVEKGDIVHLKEIPMGPSNELRSKAMDHLVMTHGLRHENVNPLIGWLNDPSRTAMVFEFCSRGSLQDILIMDDIKLDWSFRLSLLTDLVRGMRYLHASPLRVHGALTSRNCVVDARWVLKITDYGLPAFKYAQGIAAPLKTAKELLWMAPEIVRNNKSPAKYPYSQPGDVYSFGIIMQEVVLRGEPYCMLKMTPEEIIGKIKRAPPLIRPSVSKGAAPPEAINIMRQCWAENPDSRPDFNSVFERFRQLNQGRKVNFVDTMFQMLEKYSNNLEELIRERTAQLEIERKKTEQLLNRMLPGSVAEKLKMGHTVEPEEFADVTIYFSDIVGFTTIAAHCTPVQVVDLLNDLYTCFDDTINAYSVYKVETIGDAYMVVSGLPVRIADHAEQIATMALDLLHQSGKFQVKHLPGVPLQLRIGLHTGPCCAGVVGLTMPRYCLFGDTVNTASRMESTGSSWRIHLSEITRDRLVKAGGYVLEPRGPIEIKGKGLMNTYWLLGKKGFDKVLPTPPTIGSSFATDAPPPSTPTPSTTRTGPYVLANQSSSQSSSLCGAESIDVKVEITPPRDGDNHQLPSQLSNSYSIDSSATMNLCLNLADFISPNTSPQSRKTSDTGPSPEGLLSAMNSFGAGFGGGARFTSASNSNSATKLHKKIGEIIEFSSPYNYYRCLSPSESNLTQCMNENRYLHRNESRPGSTRLLRRQFSLDRDDCPSGSASARQTLDVPILQEHRTSPTNLRTPGSGRLLKQNSASVAIDLEKIEEIPISPTSNASSSHRENSNSNLRSSQTSIDLDPVCTIRLDTGETKPTTNGKNTSNEISLTVDTLIVR